MKMLSELRRAEAVDCPYLPDRDFVQDYFFATGLDEHEYGVLLSAGWRRFGTFFFRPACPGCRQCIPLRVDAEALEPSHSQRRVLRRGRDIRMEAVPPRASDEAWRVYEAHSLSQFGNKPHRDGFERTFFDAAAPALQTEYRLNGELLGLGFLDVGDSGFSSAYFAFDPAFARYSPGTLSVLMESSLTKRNHRRWYYLGYWVPGSSSMDYKSRFNPHQLYDWESERWLPAGEHPAAGGRNETPEPDEDSA
jgi:arginine-tRNA-protein transferase